MKLFTLPHSNMAMENPEFVDVFLEKMNIQWFIAMS